MHVYRYSVSAYTCMSMYLQSDKDLVLKVTALRPLATVDRMYCPGAGKVDGLSTHRGETAKRNEEWN